MNARAFAVLAFVVFVPAASAAGAITSAQLALMPLPKQSLGAGAVALPLDPFSGVVTNADAADDALSTGVTGATFARLGRITGYTLDYNDAAGAALNKRRGLLEIETSVELYRSSGAARAGFAFHRRDDAKFATLKLVGASFVLTPLKAPRLGDTQYGWSVITKLKGKPPIYGAEVVVQAGALIAITSVAAAERSTSPSLAGALAKQLQARIDAVLAGTISGPPVTLPGKLKAGPPPHGPDLSALALRPSDVGRGKVTVTHQGYQLDKDLTPISEYVRELDPAGPFVFLRQEVALFHSATEASYTITFLEAALKSPDFLRSVGAKDFKQAHITSFASKPVALRAGDEGRGVLATVGLADGRKFNEGFVLLRVGSTTQFIIVATAIGTRLLPSALADLAGIAARRAQAGLHK